MARNDNGFDNLIRRNYPGFRTVSTPLFPRVDSDYVKPYSLEADAALTELRHLDFERRFERESKKQKSEEDSPLITPLSITPPSITPKRKRTPLFSTDFAIEENNTSTRPSGEEVCRTCYERGTCPDTDSPRHSCYEGYDKHFG
jgi:hypothetical protein